MILLLLLLLLLLFVVIVILIWRACVHCGLRARTHSGMRSNHQAFTVPARSRSSNDVVPIVMGARKADYLAAAPPHSFIHVEDFHSAQHLADYLLKLDRDDRLYNQYFLWKATGSFVNTKFWCRMCAMLHDVSKPALWYRDVERWWRDNATCTRDRWDRPADYVNEYHL